MDTKYSLTTLLNDLLKLQNNSYQIIDKLSDIVSSNAETVEVPVMDSNGVLQSVVIPSFGSIKNQLVRLENDIKSISGIGDFDSSVQLSDGSFRKILVSQLQKEAEDIKSLTVPTQFNTRENWFFESFLNPLLYIKFDLTNQIKFNTENVEVSRYILNIDNEEKTRVFKENFLEKDDIIYQNFVDILVNNNITYFLDKDVTTLPPRTVRYYGNFAVTKITDDTLTETIDNVNYQKRVLRVQLDKLNYSDSQSKFEDTNSLKIGDFLLVNNGRKNTRYEIIGVESSKRTVSLKLVEGFDPISIGTNILSIYTQSDTPVTVDINIGFNEYCVVFIKPIDPDSKISAVNWSPGVGLYTNDLTIKNSKNEDVSLTSFYQNEVVDFGAYLYSVAKDGVIPSTLGLIPDSPVLDSQSFKVLQVNKHITDTSALGDLKKLQSDKLRVQSTINTLDSSISALRSKLQTTRYTTKQLEDTDRNELSKLILEKNSQSSLFASIIDDINKIGTSNTVEDLTPKYRVRGFFPMPLPKVSPRTSPQEVVQFVIQYKYLSKDGGANQPDQIEFTDIDGQVRRGTFSNWIEIKSDVRKRTVDIITGNTIWATEDVESADSVNINVIDIPISAGEAIQFRIKSLSESGWPYSPKESIWSDIVTVDFPSEYESSPDVSSILQEAKNEKVRIALQNELTTLGVQKHVSNSLDQGGKFYAHPALEISSGFLTPEQNIISLFDKLISMDNEISSLRSLIESARGTLVVRIVDENGVEYEITPNTTLRLFAGNYRDQVASYPVRKGVIITKNYFIKISNSSASNLELYSRFWGSKSNIAQPSFSNGSYGVYENSPYNGSDTDYNRVRRYDYVPVALSNPSTTELAYGFANSYPESSSQVLGQFIQSRYVSIEGNRNLYGGVNGTSRQVYKTNEQINGGTLVPSTSYKDIEYYSSESILNDVFTNVAAGSTGSGDFIWAGCNTTNGATRVVSYNDLYARNPNYYNDNIFVHIDHPDISSFISNSNPNLEASLNIRNSIFANIPVGSTGSALQNPFAYWGTGMDSNNIGLTNKIGFEPNDQYLLGPKSTGAYLFLNPSSYSDLVVDGSDSLSFRTILFGDNNSISVPVTFQYRMTDYFGQSTTGSGNLGGVIGTAKGANLTYTKTIGIDIYSNPINKERFSFDIEVTARYYSRNYSEYEIPGRTFQSAIDDLTGTLKVLSPNTSRDTVRNEQRNSIRSDSNRSV